MKAWKVFRLDNASDFLRSVYASGMAGAVYTRGVKNRAPRWLKKEGYFPTVFQTKEQAREFADNSCNYSDFLTCVEEVEVGREKPLPNMCLLSALSVGEIEQIVNYPWPRGTMMVKWVRPLKEEADHDR